MAFYALALLIFMNVNGILEGLFGIANVSSPLMLLFCTLIIVWLKPRRSDINVFFSLFILFWLSYFILGAFSALAYFQYVHISLSELKKAARIFFTGCLVFSAVYLYTKRRSGHEQTAFSLSVLWIFTLTLCMGLLEGVLGYKDVLYVGKNIEDRTLGFFGNPNETGLQANLTFVIASYLFLRKKIGYWWMLFLSGICLYGAVASFSKTAIATAVFLQLFFLLHVLRQSVSLRAVRRRGSLSYLLMISLTLVLLLPPLLSNFYQSLNTGQIKRLEAIAKLAVEGRFDNTTTSNRAGIFSDALVKIKQKPLFGYGLSAFSKPGMFPSSPTHGVHNFYLQLIGEAGIFPLLLLFFAIFFAYIYLAMRYSYNQQAYLLIAFLAAFALYSFSTHNVFAAKFLLGTWAWVIGQVKVSAEKD